MHYRAREVREDIENPMKLLSLQFETGRNTVWLQQFHLIDLLPAIPAFRCDTASVRIDFSCFGTDERITSDVEMIAKHQSLRFIRLNIAKYVAYFFP